MCGVWVDNVTDNRGFGQNSPVRSRRRWWPSVLMVLALGVIALPSVLVWRRLISLDVASYLVGLLGLLALVNQLIRWGLRHVRTLPPSTPDQLDQAQRKLAEVIGRQWRDEAELWQVTDPDPLPVWWRFTDLDVMDRPEVVAGDRLPGPVRKFRWRGRTDEIGRLVADFAALPRRRVVVLGDPGAGKSTLVKLLLLALLEQRREPREPVPVLLSLGSWNPLGEGLADWIVRRLAEDYPALRAEAYGATAPHGLVFDRRVFPILDGLDEIAEGLRPAALRAINRALVGTDPIVVTCRTEEYQAAVRSPAGDVITAAAVIEAEPVGLDDALKYLRATVPPARLPLWQPLFEHVRQGPDSELTKLVRTPLMVMLVRTMYAEGNDDPAALLDRDRFPDHAAVEDHLLDSFIPALYTRAADAGTSALPSRGRWDPDRARRWLTFLATHMSHLGTREIAWWHVHRAVSALNRPFPRAAIIGLLAWLVAGALLAGLAGVWLGPAGMLLGVSVGAASGLATAAAILFTPMHDRVVGEVRRQRRWRRYLRRVAAGIAAGFTYGLATGLIVWCGWRLSGAPGAFSTGVVIGLTVVPLVGIPYGLTAGVNGLLTAADVPSRTEIHFRGRWTVLARVFKAELVGRTGHGIATGLVMGIGSCELVGLPWGFAYGLAAGSAQGAALHGLLFGLIYAISFGVGGLVIGSLWGLVWGVSFGLSITLILGITNWVRQPVPSDQATSPRSTMRADRVLSWLLILLLTVTFAAVFVLVFGLVIWVSAAAFVPIAESTLHRSFDFSKADTLSAAITLFAPVGAVTGCLIGGFSGAWPYYFIARTWLAITRRSPWRLMRFLDNACQLGILRQVGAVYQFRHARLHDKMAEPHEARIESRAGYDLRHARTK